MPPYVNGKTRFTSQLQGMKRERCKESVSLNISAPAYQCHGTVNHGTKNEKTRQWPGSKQKRERSAFRSTYRPFAVLSSLFLIHKPFSQYCATLTYRMQIRLTNADESWQNDYIKSCAWNAEKRSKYQMLVKIIPMPYGGVEGCALKRRSGLHRVYFVLRVRKDRTASQEPDSAVVGHRDFFMRTLRIGLTL